MNGKYLPIQSKQKKDNQKYGYIKSLWIYMLFGLILIPLMGFGQNFLFQMSIAFAMIIFLIMTSLISDFSSVLLDVRDKAYFQLSLFQLKTINAKKIYAYFYLFILFNIGPNSHPSNSQPFTQGIVFFILTGLEILLMNLFYSCHHSHFIYCHFTLLRW